MRDLGTESPAQNLQEKKSAKKSSFLANELQLRLWDHHTEDVKHDDDTIVQSSNDHGGSDGVLDSAFDSYDDSTTYEKNCRDTFKTDSTDKDYEGENTVLSASFDDLWSHGALQSHEQKKSGGKKKKFSAYVAHPPDEDPFEALVNSGEMFKQSNLHYLYDSEQDKGNVTNERFTVDAREQYTSEDNLKLMNTGKASDDRGKDIGKEKVVSRDGQLLHIVSNEEAEKAFQDLLSMSDDIE